MVAEGKESGVGRREVAAHIFHLNARSWFKMYPFASRRVPFVCASRDDPYIQVRGAIQHIKSTMRVLELLSTQFIAQFSDVGLIFAWDLTVVCVLK